MARGVATGFDRRRGARPRLPPGEVGFRELLSIYRRQAASRGLRFELPDELFRAQTSSPCHYCGAEPGRVQRIRSRSTLSTTREACSYRYNGLDRVDNTQGYTVANVVPCCAICNSMKGSMDKGAFLAQARKIAEIH